MEIKGYGYEKVVDQYVRSLEGLSARGREDRAKELMRLSSGRDLSKEQMICLLKVANQEMKTHFQLGIVRAGFSGRYDRNTGEIEPFYVRQTRLEFPEGKMRNRPVLVSSLDFLELTDYLVSTSHSRANMSAASGFMQRTGTNEAKLIEFSEQTKNQTTITRQ